MSSTCKSLHLGSFSEDYLGVGFVENIVEENAIAFSAFKISSGEYPCIIIMIVVFIQSTTPTLLPPFFIYLGNCGVASVNLRDDNALLLITFLIIRNMSWRGGRGLSRRHLQVLVGLAGRRQHLASGWKTGWKTKDPGAGGTTQWETARLALSRHMPPTRT